MRGLDRLRFVLGRLREEDGDNRDRLQTAGFVFLIASARRASWPAGLRAEAERIRAGLMTIGIADGGVWDADETDIIAATDDLRRLCERAERVLGSAGRPQAERYELALC